MKKNAFISSYLTTLVIFMAMAVGLHNALATPAPQPAPDFTLMGVDGKQHALAEYRGRPVALFFYCGCMYCHRCATAWGAMQRSGTLAQVGKPLTLVLFHGEADEAREFAAVTHLDGGQTVLLLDPDEKISGLYKADPCPRVFVLDAASRIHYTNDENGPDSYKMPAPLIVARTVDALRALANTPRKTDGADKGQKQ